MTKGEENDSSTITDLMETACERALLDEWALVGDEVRLKVGTYEIVLSIGAAAQFVRSLLKNYENAIERRRS